ncbi:hypothetical protein ACLKA7_007575 [Drosophila subpalustris]
MWLTLLALDCGSLWLTVLPCGRQLATVSICCGGGIFHLHLLVSLVLLVIEIFKPNVATVLLSNLAAFVASVCCPAAVATTAPCHHSLHDSITVHRYEKCCQYRAGSAPQLLAPP